MLWNLYKSYKFPCGGYCILKFTFPIELIKLLIKCDEQRMKLHVNCHKYLGRSVNKFIGKAPTLELYNYYKVNRESEDVLLLDSV